MQVLIPLVAQSEKGDHPWINFLEELTDTRDRARTIQKVLHLSEVHPAEYQRPMVDTLDGPIKELRFGQLRVLFSAEQELGYLLILTGERKDQDQVTPELIEEAKNLRARWLERRDAVPLNGPGLKAGIKRRHLRWPNE